MDDTQPDGIRRDNKEFIVTLFSQNPNYFEVQKQGFVLKTDVECNAFCCVKDSPSMPTRRSVIIGHIRLKWDLDGSHGETLDIEWDGFSMHSSVLEHLIREVVDARQWELSKLPVMAANTGFYVVQYFKALGQDKWVCKTWID